MGEFADYVDGLPQQEGKFAVTKANDGHVLTYITPAGVGHLNRAIRKLTQNELVGLRDLLLNTFPLQPPAGGAAGQ